MVRGPLLLRAGIAHGKQACALIAVCIAFPIAARSGTDVPVARMLDGDDLVGIPGDDASAPPATGGSGRAPPGETSEEARMPKPAAPTEETDDARS